MYTGSSGFADLSRTPLLNLYRGIIIDSRRRPLQRTLTTFAYGPAADKGSRDHAGKQMVPRVMLRRSVLRVVTEPTGVNRYGIPV